MVGGVSVLQLDRIGEHAERGEEGALELVDELAAVDRRADLAGDDVGEQQVLATPSPATRIGSESSEPGSVRGLRAR